MIAIVAILVQSDASTTLWTNFVTLDSPLATCPAAVLRAGLGSPLLFFSNALGIAQGATLWSVRGWEAYRGIEGCRRSSGEGESKDCPRHRVAYGFHDREAESLWSGSRIVRCINLTLWEDEACGFTHSPWWYLTMQESNRLLGNGKTCGCLYRRCMLDVALRWCASNIDLALTTVQSAGTRIDHVGPSEMNVT